MLNDRLRSLLLGALLVLASLSLGVAGCAPEFTEDECETNADCFPDETCNQLGFCIRNTGGDTGTDTGGDADTEDPDTEPVVDSIDVEPETGEIQVGGTLQLNASATDADGNSLVGVTFEWSSDDESIATVDEDGVVTGVAEGTASIEVSAEDTDVTATVSIDVVPATVDAVELSAPDVEMFVGEMVDVDATAIDANGDELPDATFVWSVGDESVATVDAEGVVTGVAAGETDLTANSEGVEATIDVTVLALPIDRVEITPEGPHTIEVGSSALDLDATAFDSNDEEVTGEDVEWTSSDDAIASVDADGIVTGEAVGGPVDITATIGGETASVSVEVESGNQPPVADAGSAETVDVGETTTLDGSASLDGDGDTLSYAWSISAAPTGSTAALSSPSMAMTDLTPDVAGDFVVELTVSDGNGGMSTASVTITANGLPTATDDTAMTDEDTPVDVDVLTNDTDPEAGPLILTSVTSPNNGTAMIDDQGTTGPGDDVINYAPASNYDGSDSFDYTVTDSNGATDTATVTVTISAVNDLPVADAGQDRTVETGSQVTLDGSGSSDVETSPLTFSWSLTSIPTTSTATLSDMTAESPTFTADLSGVYIAELTVEDGDGATATDTVEITSNNLPTFTSTPVTNVDQDATYTYDITTSDADGDSVAISAGLQGGSSLPAWLTFTDNNDGTATLTGTPTNADVGIYNIEVIADDGTDTVAQNFAVSVINVNDAPARSGRDRRLDPGYRRDRLRARQ